MMHSCFRRGAARKIAAWRVRNWGGPELPETTFGGSGPRLFELSDHHHAPCTRCIHFSPRRSSNRDNRPEKPANFLIPRELTSAPNVVSLVRQIDSFWNQTRIYVLIMHETTSREAYLCPISIISRPFFASSSLQSRLALAPGVSYLIATGAWDHAFVSLAILGWTDWLDGFLARRCARPLPPP